MTEQSPLTVSVITVCFNSGKTLGRALRSVAEQTWPHVEHIVIDGGSTDNTSEILRDFPHLAQVVSEPDKGIYDAMNKGLTRIHGDVVCFLNSDDYYASTDILAQVAQMMAEEGLDALFGDVVFFNATAPLKIVRRYRSDRFRPERIAYGWIPAHPALFLRRHVVERVGFFHIDYKIAGDFEFMARVFSEKSLRYRYVRQVFTHMQSGGASTSGLRSKIILNIEVLRACRDNNIKTNIFNIMSKYPLKLLEVFLK